MVGWRRTNPYTALERCVFVIMGEGFDSYGAVETELIGQGIDVTETAVRRAMRVVRKAHKD